MNPTDRKDPPRFPSTIRCSSSEKSLQGAAVDRQPPLSRILLVQIGSQDLAARTKFYVHVSYPTRFRLGSHILSECT